MFGCRIISSSWFIHLLVVAKEESFEKFRKGKEMLLLFLEERKLLLLDDIKSTFVQGNSENFCRVLSNLSCLLILTDCVVASFQKHPSGMIFFEFFLSNTFF